MKHMKATLILAALTVIMLLVIAGGTAMACDGGSGTCPCAC